MTDTNYKIPKGVRAQIEMIDPKRALSLLENAADNRNISPLRVAGFRQMIERGEWHLINQGVAIGHDGKLYDGQHRLWAIAESGTPVPVLVFYGMSEEAREAVDKGRSRTVSDELRMFAGLANASTVVAYVKFCARLYAGTGGSKIIFPTRTMFEEWYGCFKDGVDMAVAHLGTSGAANPFRRAPVAGSFAFAHKANPEKVQALAQRLKDGTGLEKNEPMWALRRALLESTRAEADTASVTSRKVLRAIHMALRGESAANIQDSEKGITYFRKSYEDSRKLKSLLAPFKEASELSPLKTSESMAAAADAMEEGKEKAKG